MLSMVSATTTVPAMEHDVAEHGHGDQNVSSMMKMSAAASPDFFVLIDNKKYTTPMQSSMTPTMRNLNHHRRTQYFYLKLTNQNVTIGLTSSTTTVSLSLSLPLTHFASTKHIIIVFKIYTKCINVHWCL